MKFKLLVLAGSILLLIGCTRLSSMTEGPSFRQQLTELVQLRDAGRISEQEYRSLTQQIRHLMMH